ncbi:MAG: DUF167 domain-containing protein [Mesorhizobium sp.]|nr:DUF167 family protein [Mesorhizobium sp.]MBL8577611.1 DUF167 domain-containing protein [Mesorhizobium sp.]
MVVSDCYRIRPDGIDLTVRLTPKSSADAIDGLGVQADGAVHLAARVRAVPDKGAANAALERLLAGGLGLPRSSVAIIGGSTSRLKTVRLTGNPDDLAAALGEVVAQAGRRA